MKRKLRPDAPCYQAGGHVSQIVERILGGKGKSIHRREVLAVR